MDSERSSERERVISAVKSKAKPAIVHSVPMATKADWRRQLASTAFSDIVTATTRGRSRNGWTETTRGTPSKYPGER